MTFLRIAGAAALVALSVSAAAACDDYAEEMALAAAVKASEAEKSAAAQPATPPAPVQTAMTASQADTSRH
jgi:hypothetical protein